MNIKRWPGIRHIRAMWLAYRVDCWARQWGQIGIGLGHPNPADVEHLRAIWRGDA